MERWFSDGAMARMLCRAQAFTPVVFRVSTLSALLTGAASNQAMRPRWVIPGTLVRMNSSSAGKSGTISLQPRISSITLSVSVILSARRLARAPSTWRRMTGSTLMRVSSKTSNCGHTFPDASACKLCSEPPRYVILRRFRHRAWTSRRRVRNEPSSWNIPSGKSTYFKFGSTAIVRARSA